MTGRYMHSRFVRVLGLFEAGLGFACEIDGSSVSVAQLPSKGRSTR